MAIAKRWSIDSADARALSALRHDVMRELGSVTERPEDQFAAEILLGEVLIHEASDQPQAVVLEIVHDLNDSTLHIYSQLDTSGKETLGELQEMLSSKCGLPLRMYLSPQGVHIQMTFNTRRAVPKRRLRSLWDIAYCVLADRTERILHRRRVKPSRARFTSVR